MNRYGLALSGGGFRASLYHLGVIRYLRDAGIIQSVRQISSVSGGSVLAAHLVLNWDRYCGSDAEFQQVSGELIRFVQMDVRNRFVRRFPFTSMVNWGRRTVRLQAWGPYAIVEDEVELGSDCFVEAHAIVKNGTILGDGCRVGHFAVLGGEPQHLGFDPTTSWL